MRIYDYVDSRVPVLARMFQRRLAGYRSIGYQADESAESPVTRNGGTMFEIEDV